MDYGRLAERLMMMDETAWERHANPLSLWTRVPILPLLSLSIYARVWIGWWVLLPLALLMIWTVLNPRAFPRPTRKDTWAYRGVAGERVWLARKTAPIPAEFARMAHILTAISAVGVAILVYGLVMLEPWPTIAGTLLAFLGKLWFVDRMVWLYDVMHGAGSTLPSSS